MKGDMNYKFGPFLGNTKPVIYNKYSNNSNKIQNSNQTYIANNDNHQYDFRINNYNEFNHQELDQKQTKKINYFNSNVRKSTNTIIKNTQDNNCGSKNSDNEEYNKDVHVRKINFNNKQSSFEADFKKLNIDEKLNKENIHIDPSKVIIIKKLSLLNENINKNNLIIGENNSGGDSQMNKDESKIKSQVLKEDLKNEMIVESEEESNSRFHNNNLRKNEEKNNIDHEKLKFKNLNCDKKINISFNHYSNNFPSKNIFNQNVLNQSSDTSHNYPSNSGASFMNEDSDQYNSPIIYSNTNHTIDRHLINKSGYNESLSPGQNNFNPINYYKFLDINNFVNSERDVFYHQEDDSSRYNQQNLHNILHAINNKKNDPNNEALSNQMLNENSLQNSFSNNISNFEHNIANNLNRVSGNLERKTSINIVDQRIGNNTDNLKNFNNFKMPNNNFAENMYQNNIHINLPIQSNHNFSNKTHYNKKANYNLNNKSDLFHCGNYKNLKNINPGNKPMIKDQMPNCNNVMFGSKNIFNNNIPNPLILTNNGAFFSKINHNLVTDMIFKNHLLLNNQVNNFQNSSNNMNNVNNLLLLANCMNNFENPQNRNANTLILNHLMNITPLLKQQIAVVNNNHNEILHGKDNSINGDNSNPTILDNLNELLIRGLENILNLTDRIDETVFNKIKNNFIILLKSQNGSRVFQKYLKNTHPLIIKKIFAHINPTLTDLLMDPYANYFCQKFFVFLEKEDRLQFLKKVN